MLSWRIGNVKVTQIVELTTASLGPHLLPQAEPAEMLKVPCGTAVGFSVLVSKFALFDPHASSRIAADAASGATALKISSSPPSSRPQSRDPW